MCTARLPRPSLNHTALVALVARSETPLDLAMFKGKFSDRSDFKEVVKLLETGELGGGEGKYMDYDV